MTIFVVEYSHLFLFMMMKNRALEEELVWRKNEADVNRLVEERGVGASKYNDTIDKVIMFCEDYIKINRKNMPDGWKFAVDQKIIREFDFFDYLRLVITIKDIGEQPLNYSGSGRSYSYEAHQNISDKTGC